MNRGAAGARALNLALQAALNPPGTGQSVERFGWTFRARRQGDAGRERLRQARCSTATSASSPRSIDDEAARSRSTSTAARSPTIRRARRAGARLRDDHPQGAGLGVPGGRDPGRDPALRRCCSATCSTRRHARQAPGGARRPAQGGRHRRAWHQAGGAGRSCASCSASTIRPSRTERLSSVADTIVFATTFRAEARHRVAPKMPSKLGAGRDQQYL